MGKLIVIEGLDGSGKGTQSEKLVDKLISEGIYFSFDSINIFQLSLIFFCKDKGFL